MANETSVRKWRVLAHEEAGPVALQNRGQFDELVLDDWLHVEQMDDGLWWLRVGDARILVTLRSGKPPEVDVERGFYGPKSGRTEELGPIDDEK